MQDNCPTGAMGWVSTTLNDWDSDGCVDRTEDEDIDNDGILDIPTPALQGLWVRFPQFSVTGTRTDVRTSPKT